MVHRVGAGATQLDEHAGAPVVVEQRPVGGVHFVPQPPQFAVPVRSVSHPSSGFVEQCANPDTHALAGT